MSYGCDWLFPKQYNKMVMVCCKNLTLQFTTLLVNKKYLNYYLISKIERK